MRRWLAIGGAALLLGCATASTRVASEPLAADDLALRARLLAMADARRPDSALLDAALALGRPSPLRAAAALGAGQVGARTFAPRLRFLLADGDTAVAASAAFALGLLRDTAGIDALAAAIVDGGVVAREAAWALGEIGAPARGALTALLAAASPAGGRIDTAALADLPRLAVALETAPRPLRPGRPAVAALLLAAQRLRPVPAALVLPFVPSADAAAETGAVADRPTWAATYAVSRVPVPAAARALLPLVLSRDPDVRATAAMGLRRAATGDSLAADALPVLRTLAGDPSAQVRVNAVRALATHGAVAREALLRATGDADANVRVAAAQSLARAVTDPAEWDRLWSADTGFMFRRSLFASAAQAGVVLASDDRWSRSNDWRERAAVAEAAAGAPWPVVQRLAMPFLRDPDGRVRNAAWGVLAPWVDSAAVGDTVRTLMLGALEDEDFFARATALGALASRPRAADLPAVLRSYARARADSANDARLAAVAWLAAAWRADSARFDDAARRDLAALAPPADPLEREASRGIAPLRHWPGREGEARPAAWYQQVLAGTAQPALAGRPPRARIRTERGDVTIELFGEDAPITAHNFMTLARAGYYRDTRFHRVVPNFVAQDGDPRGDGNGGPGYAIRDELNRRRYERGAVGMALSGPDTGGSQYFLTHSAQPHLDGHYTVFGRVIAGFDVLDRLVQGDRILDVVVAP